MPLRFRHRGAGRLLLNAGAAISLLVAVAVAVLWVRGYNYMENAGVNWRSVGASEPVPHHLWLISSMGAIELRLQTGSLLFSSNDLVDPHAYHQSVPRPIPLARIFGDYDPSWFKLGFTTWHYGGFGYCRAVGRWETHTDVMVPIWFSELLLLASPVIAAALIIKHGRRQSRTLRGECPQCGYDMRWSGGRCPECGFVMLTRPAITTGA
jgi:hypothetical protein